MMTEERNRPSKWWFWIWPTSALVYALIVVCLASTAEHYWLSNWRLGSGPALAPLLWLGRVAYLLLEPVFVGLCLSAADPGRWVIILLPLLALLSASVLVGLSVHRLAARAYVRALVPVLVLLVVVSGLFCLRVIGQGTGSSSQRGGVPPGAASDPARRYQEVLDEIRREYFVREWRYLWEEGMFLDAKTGFGPLSEIFHSVVVSQIAVRGMPEFLTLLEARVAQPDEFTGWDIAVAGDLVIYLVLDSSDRGSLVTLLSLHCPRYVGLSSSIEEFIARAGQGRLPTPILALCDAYDRSTAPTAKEALVNALDKGFFDIKNEGLDEGARVDAYRQWYLQHRGMVVCNVGYDGRETPLFVVVEPEGLPARGTRPNGPGRTQEPPTGRHSASTTFDAVLLGVPREALWEREARVLRSWVADQVESLGIEEFLTLADEWVGQVPSIDWRTSDGKVVLRELIIYLVASGDRENLVHLLSLYCPDLIYLEPVEWQVVRMGKETLPDPILVFCDAYDRSTVPDAKKALVKALHRAFPMLYREASAEGAFVQSCRRWYLEHKDALTVHPEYAVYDFFKTPLFVVKEAEDVD